MITGITTEALAEHVRIAVQTTAVVEYTAFTLQEPPRLVLTFPGVTLGDIPLPIPVAGVVRSIEPVLVPEENAVRCVVYLAYMTTHAVEIQGRQLLITLADAGVRTAETAPRAATETARTGATTALLPASRRGQGPTHAPGTLITGITFEALAKR